MQQQMSEGNPTATADTRECDQEAAAEAKKPTELGSSPTAAAPPAAPPVAPKQQTDEWGDALRKFGITLSKEPTSGWGVETKAKGGACAGDSGGWGAPANLRSTEPSGWGVKKKSNRGSCGGGWGGNGARQTPAQLAREVFLVRIEDAE